MPNDGVGGTAVAASGSAAHGWRLIESLRLPALHARPAVEASRASDWPEAFCQCPAVR